MLYSINTGGQRRSSLERFDLAGNPIDWPGLLGPNESQTVTFQGSWEFSDTFTLTCPNSETTAAIEYGSESQEISAHIKAALESKCGGTFRVEGGFFNQTVQFEGTFAHTNVPKMTCTKVTGAGSCEITNVIDGSPGTNAIHVNCGGENSCSQVVVDNSGGPNEGTIYVASSSQGGRVQVFLPDGTNVGPITNVPGDPIYGNEAPCGVAVDDEGNLYVTHAEGQIAFTFVDRYAPLEWATHHQQTVPATGTIRPLDFNTPCRTAVDSSKSLLISTGQEYYVSGALHRIAPNSFGPPVEPFTPGTSSTIINSGAREPAVDSSNDDVYVPINGKILRFDSNDSQIEEFGSGELSSEIGGLDVDGQTGKVYLSDGVFGGSHEVRIYKPVTVPDAITQDATGVLHTEATLHGHIDPVGAGEITGCEFQYVKDSLFNASKFASATSVPCSPAAPQTSATDVSASISGLAIEEGFHFRLRATDANGTVERIRQDLQNPVGAGHQDRSGDQRRPAQRHPERVVHRRVAADRILLRMGHEPVLRQPDPDPDPALALRSHPGAAGPAGARTRDALPLPDNRQELARDEQRRRHDLHHAPGRDRARNEAGDLARPGKHHAQRGIPRRRPRHEVLLRIRADDGRRKRNA